MFIVGSVSLLAFFPRAEAQTRHRRRGEIYTPPTETIEPDQLARVQRWIDAQPRVSVPVPANGAQVLIVKFNDYQCPSCRQAYLEYKAIVAKYQRRSRKVRFVTMDFPLESECNGAAAFIPPRAKRQPPCGWRRRRASGAEMEEWLYSNQEKMTPTWVEGRRARSRR